MKKIIIENQQTDEIIEQYDYCDEDENLKLFLKKYSEPIGVFLFSFSSLEHELNTSISEFFIDDAVHLGYLVIKNLSFRNKIDLFNDLLTSYLAFSKNKELNIKKSKIVYQNLILINSFRNNIVHADWTTLDKNNFVRTKIVVDEDGEMVKGRRVKISVKDINRNIKNIYLIIEQLDKIKSIKNE